MSLKIKRMTPGAILKAASRPTGLAMGLISVTCVFAIILLVPWSQYALAVILGLGLVALVAILTLHTLALTRWAAYLEQLLLAQNREWRPVGKSVARFDAYAHAADLNVGRIAMLQAKLEGRLSELEGALTHQREIEARLVELELGLDRAAVRMSDLERGLEVSKPNVVTVEPKALKLAERRKISPQTSELRNEASERLRENT